mmetsp:Transcript_39280/g.123893  ORF Transcript_39280/g.123893 Transcript_39280/m.123893 type:complete len:272 (+) Transcript_39280:536-1351(+)
MAAPDAAASVVPRVSTRPIVCGAMMRLESIAARTTAKPSCSSGSDSKPPPPMATSKPALGTSRLRCRCRKTVQVPETGLAGAGNEQAKVPETSAATGAAGSLGDGGGRAGTEGENGGGEAGAEGERAAARSSERESRSSLSSCCFCSEPIRCSACTAWSSSCCSLSSRMSLATDRAAAGRGDSEAEDAGVIGPGGARCMVADGRGCTGESVRPTRNQMCLSSSGRACRSGRATEGSSRRMTSLGPKEPSTWLTTLYAGQGAAEEGPFHTNA